MFLLQPKSFYRNNDRRDVLQRNERHLNILILYMIKFQIDGDVDGFGFCMSAIESAKIKDADEVIFTEDIKVIIDYPLTRKFVFDICTIDGKITRKYLAQSIVDTYRNIYREKEESTAIPILDLDDRIKYQNGLINRNRTDGKYGIWGHDIDDLYLCGLKFDPVTEHYKLFVDS